MNVMNSYWKFIMRPLPIYPGLNGFESHPNMVVDTTFWIILFISVEVFIPLFLNKYFKAQFLNLSKRKQLELPSYIACLIHHLYAVSRGWINIVRDLHLSTVKAGIFEYAVTECDIAPFCLGCFIADIIVFAIPEAIFRRNFEFLFHHGLVVWLVMSSLVGPGSLTRFIPHLLICETTSVFFTIAWLLRLIGFKGSTLVSILEICFAVSFLFIRVINLPMAFLAIASAKESEYLGYAKYTTIPIVMLQFYWFYKIVAALVDRLFNNNPKAT